jgi:hypothetical protein
MSINCPFCNSERVRALNHARKVGGTAGAFGGAATGAASAVAGAQSGAALGAVAGPISAALGGLAGAILGGLAGGALGSLAGARMGEEIDARVLDNFECPPAVTCFQLTTSNAIRVSRVCHAPLYNSIYSATRHVCCALKLAPLLFCRPGVLRLMEWAELNLEAGEWLIIPRYSPHAWHGGSRV